MCLSHTCPPVTYASADFAQQGAWNGKCAWLSPRPHVPSCREPLPALRTIPGVAMPGLFPAQHSPKMQPGEQGPSRDDGNGLDSV